MFKVQLVRGETLQNLLISANLLNYNKMTFFTIALSVNALKGRAMLWLFIITYN